MQKFVYLSFNSNKGNYIKVIAKFKTKDRFTQNNIILDNRESIVLAHDALLDTKVASSMIDTIHEMKATSEVYVPEINKESKLNSLVNDPLHFQAFSMVIDKVRDRMKDNRIRTQGDDFVKKNKVLIKYWNQYEYERRKKHQNSRETNLNTALKRKELMLRFKREKRDILQKMKEKIKEEADQRKKLMAQVKAWFVLITQHVGAKQSWKKLENKKLKVKNARQIARAQFRMYYIYKKNTRFKAPTLNLRVLRDSVM